MEIFTSVFFFSLCFSVYDFTERFKWNWYYIICGVCLIFSWGTKNLKSIIDVGIVYWTYTVRKKTCHQVQLRHFDEVIHNKPKKPDILRPVWNLDLYDTFMYEHNCILCKDINKENIITMPVAIDTPISNWFERCLTLCDGIQFYGNHDATVLREFWNR